MYPYFLIDTKYFQLDLYGLLMFVGILAALIVFDIYTTRRGMSASSQRFFIIAIIVSIGAGIGSSMLFQSLYDFIATGVWSWNSGMTFLGGLIGGVVTFLMIFGIVNAVKKGKYTKDLVMITEVLACSVTIAHFFGRLGCFTAGCCYGKETSSIFGIHFPYLQDFGGPIPADLRVHPTQLYEAFALLVLFFLCSWLFFRHAKYALPTYLSGYGLARFVIEFYRADPRGELIGNTLSPSQQISLVMLIAGALWLIAYVVLDIRNRGKLPKIDCFTVEKIGDTDCKKYTFRNDRASVAVTDCGGALISYCVDGVECLPAQECCGKAGLIGLPYTEECVSDARWHVRGRRDGLLLTRAFRVPAEESGKMSAIVAMHLQEDGALTFDCRVRTDTDTMCGLFPSFVLPATACSAESGRFTAASERGGLIVETTAPDVYTEPCGDGMLFASRHVEELRKSDEYTCTLTLRFLPHAAVTSEAENSDDDASRINGVENEA